MNSLTELHCLIDDFCRVFEPVWERHLPERMPPGENQTYEVFKTF